VHDTILRIDKHLGSRIWLDQLERELFSAAQSAQIH